MSARRSRRQLGAPATAGAWLALAVAGAAPTSAQTALGRLALVEAQVEAAGATGAFSTAREEAPFGLGDRLRTGPGSLARLELPWMAVTVSPQTRFAIRDDFVVAAQLAEGRVELDAGAGELLKLVTPEAEVRGRGRAVVRRVAGLTSVSALAGAIHVAAANRVVTLAPGEGSLVRAGQPPSAPEALPAPPGAMEPAGDPVYVEPGAELALHWAPGQPSYHVQVLPVGAETVLIGRDVGAPPARIAIKWPGAFRWRVAAVDARGLEGMPSAVGLIAVDER